MQNEILKGIVGIGLLAVLPACHTRKQATTEDVYTIARTVQSGSEYKKEAETQQDQFSRSILIPQWQVDAQSVYNRMLTYIVPEDELAPTVQEEKLTAYVDFPANGIQINPKYGNNRAELVRLEEQLKSILHSGKGNVKKIHITGYASPDGNTKENERLAGNRAIQFKNYLQKQFNFSDPSQITIDWVGEDWSGLQRLNVESGKPYSSRVQSVFQLTDDSDSRRKQLKAMDKGEVYKDIEKTFFSRLRRMELTVELESAVETTNNPRLLELVYTQPEKLSLPELLRAASLYRPGTEQYREVYEIVAYTYPACKIAQLNAAAASLALGDKEAARYFFGQADGDQRAYNNLGVLALMDGDKETASIYFRKYMPQNPRLSRENLKIINE